MVQDTIHIKDTKITAISESWIKLITLYLEKRTEMGAQERYTILNFIRISGTPPGDVVKPDDQVETDKCLTCFHSGLNPCNGCKPTFENYKPID